MPKLYEHAYRRRRSFSLRVKVYLITGALFVAFVVAAGFVLRASIFRIKDVQVTGLRDETKEAFLERVRPLIIDTAFRRFLGSTHYLVWPDAIELHDPRITRVEVKKEFFHKKISILVTPREPFGIWCFGDETGCAWVDSGGVVIEKAPMPEGVLIPVVYDSLNAMPTAGGRVLEGPLFGAMTKMIKTFMELKIPVKRYVLNRVTEEFHAITPSTVVKISLRLTDSESAVEAFRAILEKEPLSAFEYIDLTVEKRVFVKRK